MKIPILVAGLIFTMSVIVSAETFAIHLSKEGESIVVSVYSPGERVGELKSEDLDLQKIYQTARDSEDVGPFFNLVDEYIVSDEEGRWFLIHYEYNRPGTDYPSGRRFRLGRLKRIVEGADLFFLVDYMQDCSAKALTTKMAELGELKLIMDRRGQEYLRLLHAAGKEANKVGEQAGTEQPATRSESKSECDDKPQPEAEGRSR
jgi:hypothetical protein